jgi:hypothetical protein
MQLKLEACERRCVRRGPDAELGAATANIVRARIASLHGQLAAADDASAESEWAQGNGFTMQQRRQTQ